MTRHYNLAKASSIILLVLAVFFGVFSRIKYEKGDPVGGENLLIAFIVVGFFGVLGISVYYLVLVRNMKALKKRAQFHYFDESGREIFVANEGALHGETEIVFQGVSKPGLFIDLDENRVVFLGLEQLASQARPYPVKYSIDLPRDENERNELLKFLKSILPLADTKG